MIFKCSNTYFLVAHYAKYTYIIILFNCSTCKSDSGIRSFTQTVNYRPPRGGEKIRAASGPTILPRPEDILINDPEVHYRRPKIFI